MRKKAAITAVMALSMAFAGSAYAQGEADYTQNGGTRNYGTAGSNGTTGSSYSNGTTGTAGTVGNYDARTNTDLGTGTFGGNVRHMFDNARDRGAGMLNRAGSNLTGNGSGFMGTNLGDGDHTNNGFLSTRNNNGGSTGMFGHGTGILGTNLGDGNRNNNGMFSTYGTGDNDTGFLGTRGTNTGSSYTNTNYTATATRDNGGMDWGWLGLLGLFGLVGMRGRGDQENTFNNKNPMV